MKKTTVETICGKYPDNFQKLDISSDPNYVFKSDPNYQIRKVWDVEGNSVFCKFLSRVRALCFWRLELRPNYTVRNFL